MKGTLHFDGLSVSLLGAWAGLGEHRVYRLTVVLRVPRLSGESSLTQSVHEASAPRQAWVLASLWVQSHLRAVQQLEQPAEVSP